MQLMRQNPHETRGPHEVEEARLPHGAISRICHGATVPRCRESSGTLVELVMQNR